MDYPKTELVGVIFALLPGFLAAWIFYGLTAHPKPSPFERVVQSLIFTGIVQASVMLLREFFLMIGQIISIGAWTSDVAFVWSMGIGVVTGMIFVAFANNDFLHEKLRGNCLFRGITKKTSYPSQWYSAFSQDKRHVVLHLTGEIRLKGWPSEWPDTSDAGHFVMMEPEWLPKDNKSIPLKSVERMLIPAKDVEMVEFMKRVNELDATDDEMENANSAHAQLQKMEES